MPKYIYGKNSIREALLNDSIEELFFENSQNSKELLTLAKEKKVRSTILTSLKLEQLVKTTKHQGVVAKVKEEYKYYNLSDITSGANKDFATSLIVILDGLEDPHNLGAVLRSADAFGVDGVIIPKHRSVKLNDTVAKVSTGAIEYVKVVEATNLTQTIKELKKIGYWVVAAEMREDAVPFDQIDYDMNTVLIIGSEGKGISKLVLEQADFVAYIPMFGHVNSLNASVSCAVMLAEINKRRKKK